MELARISVCLKFSWWSGVHATASGVASSSAVRGQVVRAGAPFHILQCHSLRVGYRLRKVIRILTVLSSSGAIMLSGGPTKHIGMDVRDKTIFLPIPNKPAI